MVIIDSGLGGISVVRALRATEPHRPLTYLADTAFFPYGNRTGEEITARAIRLVNAVQAHSAGPVVLACNTLSTLCLDALRAHFTMPFVGTVPAIKTAAQISKSKRFSVLATPNTAASDYSAELVEQFATSCVVDVYGAPNLAMIAESMLLGSTPEENAIRVEITPAFCNDGFGKTDCIVLGCTHYPLILDTLQRVAPWPVTWIDSSEAIARRALSLADSVPKQSIAYVTRATDVERYRDVFLREGFEDVRHLAIS